jgi:hypothetical protein
MWPLPSVISRRAVPHDGVGFGHGGRADLLVRVMDERRKGIGHQINPRSVHEKFYREATRHNSPAFVTLGTVEGFFLLRTKDDPPGSFRQITSNQNIHGLAGVSQGRAHTKRWRNLIWFQRARDLLHAN